MSIKSQIIGVDSTPMSVSREGAASVVVHPHPPIDEEVDALPFRQYFTEDGDPSGNNKMNATATAVEPKDFYVVASPDYDIYINAVSVEIGDGGTPNLNSFGALSALTTGVGFYWTTQRFGDYELHEGIKTNKEFIRIGTASAGFGDSTNAFLADVSGGGTEKSYFPLIDFSEAYGLRYGVRLKRGTTDKLLFRVQDNLSGLSTFNAQAFGLRI